MLDNSVRLIWLFVGVTQAWSDTCKLTGSNTSRMMIEVHYNWGHFFDQVIHICCNWKQKCIRTAIITHAWTNLFASIIKTHACYNYFIKTVPMLTRDERVRIMVHLFHWHLLDQHQTSSTARWNPVSFSGKAMKLPALLLPVMWLWLYRDPPMIRSQ